MNDVEVLFIEMICLFELQVDPTLPMNKQVELYETLMELLKAEEKCRNEVRDSQNEVRLR